MKPALCIALSLLLCVSRAEAAPKKTVAPKKEAAAKPAASPAAVEEEPICPEDLEAEAVAKEKADGMAGKTRKPARSALNVWDPFKKDENGEVGKGFSRYAGQDDYQASGEVAADAPPRRGGGNAKPASSSRPGGGLRIRRG